MGRYLHGVSPKTGGKRRVNGQTIQIIIAMIWVVISLAVAVFIGIVGRTLYPTAHVTATDAENIFITLATSSLPAI